MKALIVKIGAIGDVVMSLGMSLHIREQYPDAHITWVCGKAVAPIIERTESADEIIAVNENKLLAGNLLQKLAELAKIWHILFLRRFDAVYIAHQDYRYKLIALSVIAKQKKILKIIPGRYHGDEYIRLISSINDNSMLRYDVPKVDCECSEVLLDQLPNSSQKHIIAIAPGGAKNTLRDDSLRRWPIENYVLLTKELLKNNYSVVLTGAPSDRWVLAYFEGLPVVDCVGKTSILGLVSLYQKCDLVITHDSGPLHLAKLVKVKLLALFGPTIPFEKITLDGNTEVIWQSEILPCCPCYDGKDYVECTNNLCLKSITIQMVLARVRALLR